MTRPFLLLLALAGAAAGCGGATGSPSSPTPVATLTTEQFSGQLPVGGHRSYAFSLSEAGAVSLMLASLSTDTSPARPDVRVGLGIGTPAGTGCAIRESVVTTTALASQLRTWAPEGIHCVAIFDTGELPEPVSFAIRLTRF